MLLLAAVFGLAALARMEGIDPMVAFSLRDAAGYVCLCHGNAPRVAALESLAGVFIDHARLLASHHDADAWIYEAAAAVLRTAGGGRA